MSELKAIVQRYRRDHGGSETWVATHMGISKSALNGWWTRGRTNPPSAELLRALAVATRTPYIDVLDAALHDYGYLPEEGGTGHGARPAKKRMSVGRGKQLSPTPELGPHLGTRRSRQE